MSTLYKQVFVIQRNWIQLKYYIHLHTLSSVEGENARSHNPTLPYVYKARCLYAFGPFYLYIIYRLIGLFFEMVGKGCVQSGHSVEQSTKETRRSNKIIFDGNVCQTAHAHKSYRNEAEGSHNVEDWDCGFLSYELHMAAEDTASKTSATTKVAMHCYNTQYHIQLRFSYLGVDERKHTDPPFKSGNTRPS